MPAVLGSGRMGQQAHGTLTAPTRSANIDWMHRPRPRDYGAQPKAFLMTRLDKSGFTGIAGSILVLGLGIGTLLLGKLQYSSYLGRRGVRTICSSNRGAGDPRGDRHLAETR